MIFALYKQEGKEMKKGEYIADKLLKAGQRLGYRNILGEKRGELHYEANLKNIEDLKAELRLCFEVGTSEEEIEEDWR